jgi:hypothetical protein
LQLLEGVKKEGTVSDDYRRWRQRAIDDVRTKQRVVRSFTSELIPNDIYEQISAALEECTTVDDVKNVFKGAQCGK